MIKVKSLSKKFGSLEALKDLNLYAQAGSVYGLLGPNGAGKTTLLKILAGIYKEDRGEVLINGEVIFENEALKQQVLFMPDTLFFFSSYTIADMAAFYRSIYPLWDEQKYIVLQSVFEIDLNKKVQNLSRGMQRQVAIWLALSTMPRVLILDEPLDGLDTVMRQKVKKLLFQEVAERELTIIISSHNIRELEDFCDHIGIIHQGTMIIEQELDELKRDIHKIQLAFKEPVPGAVFSDLDLLFVEQRGSVLIVIAKGNKAEILQYMKQFEPVVLDALPLNLEEIFIYEMGSRGYAVENIILA